MDTTAYLTDNNGILKLNKIKSQRTKLNEIKVKDLIEF